MPAFELPYHIPLGKKVKILDAHPLGLVALEKADGVLSTPNTPGDLNKTLLKAKFDKKKEAYVWFDNQQQQRYFYVCHRLDSPTSGVIIGTIDAELALEIRRLFKTREIHKEYIAVVKGVPVNKSGEWTDYLQRSKQQNRLMVKVAAKGDIAKTSWSVLKQSQQPLISMLSLRPATGRTHQLRVQTGSRDHGIIGDQTYGDFKLNSRLKKEKGISRLFLHAHRLTIETADLMGSPFRFSVESPLPEAFTQLFDIQ